MTYCGNMKPTKYINPYSAKQLFSYCSMNFIQYLYSCLTQAKHLGIPHNQYSSGPVLRPNNGFKYRIAVLLNHTITVCLFKTMVITIDLRYLVSCFHSTVSCIEVSLFCLALTSFQAGYSGQQLFNASMHCTLRVEVFRHLYRL